MLNIVMRSLLAVMYVIATSSTTFCPVTSPDEKPVYIADTPSRLIIGARLVQCAIECHSGCRCFNYNSTSAVECHSGCRCFNYNSTSANCSLFFFEPTSYKVDQQSNTIVYQISDAPLKGEIWLSVYLQGRTALGACTVVTNASLVARSLKLIQVYHGLWTSVPSTNCSSPSFTHDGCLYCQRCAQSSVFIGDKRCTKTYDWCRLDNGQKVFCRNALIPNNLPSSASKPTDCTDIAALGCTRNGIYTIYIGTQQKNVSVYCDMETTNTSWMGTSWMVFQRRMDGSVNFYRGWADYAMGFGSLQGEFWLGNDNLNIMTSNKRYKLRIDMAIFDGSARYAEYDNFVVNSARDNYRLASLGVYSGTAGDSMPWTLGQPFSTYDKNNGPITNPDCPTMFRGAWWYGSAWCHQSNLNGYYYGGPHASFADGIEWYTWTGYQYSLKMTAMKITPVQ